MGEGEAVEGRFREDVALARSILDGNEDAFVTLIDALHRSLVHIAQAQVGRGALAEDLVQETWASVVAHLGDYAGRSSLRTWIASILINRAKTRREREKRFVPLDRGGGTGGGDEGAGDTDLDRRFGALGFWTTPPRDCPEAVALRKETRERITRALAELPDTQRAVVTLRDVEEWGSEEVCNVLGLSESNQRVLLHRGRQRLRAALESAELAEAERAPSVSAKDRA